jgi:acetyl coenzyme A synthetase (ADP forming)-like protein
MNASLEPFFEPESVAVVGASRHGGTIGYQILDNLLRHGYRGVVYPVHPTARAVHSIRAYATVLDIPDPVDLAVVVVPKDAVPGVVDQCGRKGVKALVVITAGFKEVGGHGIERERALLEQVRSHGMRLVGPNCMGVLNTDAAVCMNATFAPTMPPEGPMSFMSQSGALGVTILDYAAEYGIGIRHFVSVGNKPDVSGNDLLEYWERDPSTKVILMYLENFGNPRRFTHIARRVTRTKPIVVVKSGRTVAGARAATSHTGALAAGDDATDALLAQCGVLRADSVEELFDIAMALEEQPVPAGNRVAILTNAGGPGIIIADALESAGLEVGELTEDTRARLREVLPLEASVRNPVDMIASATGESYRAALDLVLGDPGVDAAVAAFVPPLGIRQIDVAASIVEARRLHPGKPVLAVLMGREGLPEGKAQLHEAGIPAYIFPESAARALAAMYRYRRWLDRPLSEPTVFEADRERVSALIAAARAEGRDGLLEHEALAVLGAYGIATVEHRVAADEDEAVAAAEGLGFPVVVKALSPDVVHKTELGAVRLDLRTADDVRAAVREIGDALREAGAHHDLRGWLVERFLARGRETIVGVSSDPSFGPVLMFGIGGIYVEALGDVVFRTHPVSREDAEDMIGSVRARTLLDGVRGEPGVDRGALADTLQRVSQLVGEHHAILELDINPLLAFPEGATAVDARIRVASASHTDPPSG